jgi:hypothetical protein
MRGWPAAPSVLSSSCYMSIIFLFYFYIILPFVNFYNKTYFVHFLFSSYILCMNCSSDNESFVVKTYSFQGWDPYVHSSIPSQICADFASQKQKSLLLHENVKNIRYSIGVLQQTSNCRCPLLTIFLSFHSLEITESFLWILFPFLWTEARKARQSKHIWKQ